LKGSIAFVSLPLSFSEGNACARIHPTALRLPPWPGEADCDTLHPMRRAQIIVVVLALLAAPLALLARSFSGSSSDCGQFCCLPHGSHSSQTHEAMHANRSCQHGAAHAVLCSMKSGHPGVDYGLNSPILPTSVSSLARIIPPDAWRSDFAWYRDFPAFGFPPAPLKPPRS